MFVTQLCMNDKVFEVLRKFCNLSYSAFRILIFSIRNIY